jgi:bacillithiol biosynthesis deacetylase BshB1
MTVDILAITVHPDDVELCCSGTLLRHLDMGYTVGIIDLTQGELGTRGNAQLRKTEAGEAARKMGALFRENLHMPDGFFIHNMENLYRIIKVVRSFRPKIVITNAVTDRHPDHGRASGLVSEACFLSGLSKVLTANGDEMQEKWRPVAVYHMIQDRITKPDFCVDITPFIDQKMELILTFESQFFNPESNEPDSPISGKDFLEYIKASNRVFGRFLGVEFGEGFTVERPPGVNNILDLF